MKKILVLFLSMTMVLALAHAEPWIQMNGKTVLPAPRREYGLRWKEKRRAADLRNRICFPSV